MGEEYFEFDERQRKKKKRITICRWLSLLPTVVVLISFLPFDDISIIHLFLPVFNTSKVILCMIQEIEFIVIFRTPK